jgi:polysaccharide biosynthesis protein PslG
MPRRAARLIVVLALVADAACGGSAVQPRSQPQRSGQKRVAFAILEDYDKGDDLADVARDFELFRQLGVTTWRGSFGWDDYEPSRGTYDFEWLHRFADLAASRGIMLRPYIGYTPRWAAAGGDDRDDWNDPPRDLHDWYRFVRELSSAMRRHRNVLSFEIYNEENVKQWWDGSADAYRRTLERGAAAVRAGNPRAAVLLGGMVYPDTEWLRAICTVRDNEPAPAFDVIPFHAYPETWTPPDVTLDKYLGRSFADGFVKSADALCGPKPIWINETGFATVPGRTEREQAAWWIRAIATFAAEPRVEQIGIYEIKDLKPDRAAIGDTPNYHLGITHADRTRKMAFQTIATLVRIIGDTPFTIGDLAAPINIAATDSVADLERHVLLLGDGSQLLVLWTRAAAITAAVRLPRHATRGWEYGVDGNLTREFRVDDDALTGLELQPGEPQVFHLK